MKQAIGYIRVSSDGQSANGYSLEGQAAEIEDFCMSHGIRLSAIFLEVKSAATIDKRPVFQAALQHMEGNVDYFIVTNIDRFARSAFDFEIASRQLQSSGKRLIACQQSYLTPLQGATDFRTRMASLRSAVDAEEERYKIRERVTKGRARKVAQGGWIGHRPPFGYRAVQGELQPDEREHRVLSEILRLRASGKSYRQIADLVSLSGASTPSARKTNRLRTTASSLKADLWNAATIYRIIKRHSADLCPIENEVKGA